MPPEVSTHIEDPDVDPALLENVNDDTSGVDSLGDDDQDISEGVDGLSEADLQVARDNGWTPQEDWLGDPQKWVGAKQFLDRSRGINAILKRENEALRARLDRVEGRVDANAEVERTRQVAAVDSLIADAEAQRAEAITNADGAAVVETERTIRRLEEEKAKLAPAPEKKPEISADDKAFSDQFVVDNPWMKNDRIGLVAVGVARKIVEDSPELRGKPQVFLPELRRRMMAEYPELMGRNMRAARTEGGGTPPRGPTKTTKHTFENMPKDAQAACDRLVKQGTVRKREDYVKHYWAENQ